MIKQFRFITMLLATFLLFFAQIVYPITAYGEISLTDQTDKEQLYQVTASTDLENGLTIKEGTFLYGKKDEGGVLIQFADTYITLSPDLVREVTTDQNVPSFHEPVEQESTSLSKSTSLYSIYPDTESRIVFHTDLEYPVENNQFGLEVIYIGNVEFYLNKDDRLQALEEKQQKETDNSSSEKEQEDEGTSDESVNEEDKDTAPKPPVEQNSKDETKESNTDLKQQDHNNIGEPSSDLDSEPQHNRINSLAGAKQTKIWEGVTSNYFKVTTDNLIVYDNRSGSLEPIGKLSKGQEYPRVSSYGKWHRIQFGSIFGYVWMEDTIPTDGSSIKNENKRYENQNRTFTASQSVTVYDNTSGSLVPFGTIDKGTRFAIASDYGNWWRIIYADRVGYIAKSDVVTDFVNTDKYFRAEGNIAVYDNRGSSLKKVGELEKGEVYPRVSDYGSWHRIQYGNYYGYVKKSETSVASGSALKNENKNYQNQSRTFTALQTTTVYDNSSGSLQSFGKIDKGAKFAIAGDYGSWWRVLYADRVGYVNKDNVRADVRSTDKYFRATEDTPVYDNRTGKLEEVGELKSGQAYPIVSDYGKNWWRVQFGSIYGYVSKSHTGYATKGEIKNLNDKYTHSSDKLIALKDITVYDNSSGSLVPFGELKEGAVHPLVSDYGNWWRIIYLDRVGYISKENVKVDGVKETKYDLTLEEALEVQLGAGPQTDKDYAYVSKAYISNSRVTVSTLNVRGGPGVSYHKVGSLSEGDHVNVLEELNGWYVIEFTPNRQWVHANRSDTLYYLDPLNFLNDSKQKFQFLDLSRGSDISASVLNNFLKGKGTLAGQAQAFIDAGRTHGVNDVYLISHAIHETGNGKSDLAKGVQYKGTTVYNMFGIGAYDSCAVECGARKAYEEGWTTPYKAIVGGAKFIGNEYIKGQSREGTVLNTLYKMRWNPEYMAANNRFGKQYATDIGWASKQVTTMYNLYQQLDSYTLYLDVPVYKK